MSLSVGIRILLIDFPGRSYAADMTVSKDTVFAHLVVGCVGDCTVTVAAIERPVGTHINSRNISRCQNGVDAVYKWCVCRYASAEPRRLEQGFFFLESDGFFGIFDLPCIDAGSVDVFEKEIVACFAFEYEQVHIFAHGQDGCRLFG